LNEDFTHQSYIVSNNVQKLEQKQTGE